MLARTAQGTKSDHLQLFHLLSEAQPELHWAADLIVEAKAGVRTRAQFSHALHFILTELKSTIF